MTALCLPYFVSPLVNSASERGDVDMGDYPRHHFRALVLRILFALPLGPGGRCGGDAFRALSPGGAVGPGGMGEVGGPMAQLSTGNDDTGSIARLRSAQLIQGDAQRSAGDFDQPTIRLIHFEHQKDRDGKCKRGNAQCCHNTRIAGREEPEAGEDNR